MTSFGDKRPTPLFWAGGSRWGWFRKQAARGLVNPQVGYKGRQWLDARSLRRIMQLSASLLAVDIPGVRCWSSNRGISDTSDDY